MVFRGEYAFLSNMYPAPMLVNGVTYSCVEAVFQSAKLVDKAERKSFAGLSGLQARKLGRQVQLRTDWNDMVYPQEVQGSPRACC